MQCRYDCHNSPAGHRLSPNVVSYRMVPAIPATTPIFPYLASEVALSVRVETTGIDVGASSSSRKIHAGHFPPAGGGRTKVTPTRDTLMHHTAAEITDEHLFQQYLAGVESAFNELYARYIAMLRRYVQQKTYCDSSTADEIVQQTFFRVVRKRHDFIQGKLVRPWLFTIADRLCRDHLKGLSRRSKHIRLFSECDLMRSDENRDGAEDKPTDAIMGDPRLVPVDEQLIDQEEGRKAVALLNRLPKKLRTAVELQVLNDVPSRAAGPLLNVSHMQAQNRRNMALDILRKQMETENLNGEDDVVLEANLLNDLVDDLTDADAAAMLRAFNNEASADDDRIFSSFVRRFVGEAIL